MKIEKSPKEKENRIGTMNWTPRFVSVERKIEVTHVVHVSVKTKKSGYVFPGEMHDFWEFVLVCEGNALATAEQHVYSLRDGKLLIHKPMEFHSIRSADETDLKLVIGSFCLRGELLPFFAEKLLTLTPAEEADFVRAIETLLRAEEENSALLRQKGASLFELFLLHQYEKGAPHGAGEENEMLDERCRTILKVLNDHVEKTLRLHDVARLCRMSESGVKKVFAAYTDGGVMRCFGKLKLRRAALLLEQGVAIRAVAERLSYSSAEYFHLAFKKEFGITPGAYQREKCGREKGVNLDLLRKM